MACVSEEKEHRLDMVWELVAVVVGVVPVPVEESVGALQTEINCWSLPLRSPEHPHLQHNDREKKKKKKFVVGVSVLIGPPQ